MSKAKTNRKVVVIGAGSVGTTYIYALLGKGLADEIALIDVDRKRVEGEVMDLSHGLPFIPPVKIYPGDYEDCTDADLIVVTAGAKQTPGQSRLELIQKNADIVKDVCLKIKTLDTRAVMVMVANPVDSLTQVALHVLGWPRHRVFGSGTVLDSSRFRAKLSEHCGIDTRSVHGYILGEHGDSEVAAWSLTNIAGVNIRKYCEVCHSCDRMEAYEHIATAVRNSAYHIIDYKGSTFYGIGMSLTRISSSVLRNEHSVLTISVLLDGEYDIDGVCLSVPCVVGENGAERIITAPLDEDEVEALRKSADTLKEVYKKIEI